MARKKQYSKDEVIEKAMQLFWKNGYERTSMQQLENEMGINKFSIYAAFGSKDGVFLASLELYQKKLNKLLNQLADGPQTVKAIENYFYNFLAFSKEKNVCKGCLITNAANEFRVGANQAISNELNRFVNKVRNLFYHILKVEEKDMAWTNEKADYLVVAMFGLSSASRVFNEKQLDTYIKNIFKNF